MEVNLTDVPSPLLPWSSKSPSSKSNNEMRFESITLRKTQLQLGKTLILECIDVSVFITCSSTLMPVLASIKLGEG